MNVSTEVKTGSINLTAQELLLLQDLIRSNKREIHKTLNENLPMSRDVRMDLDYDLKLSISLLDKLANLRTYGPFSEDDYANY